MKRTLFGRTMKTTSTTSTDLYPAPVLDHEMVGDS